MPHTPLKYELTHRFEGIDISDVEFQRLVDAATWKTIPEFLRRGRVARHILQEPALLKNQPGRQLTVAKLKGVGVYDPESLGRFRDRILDNFSDEPQPPTNQPLEGFVTYPHMGINKDGEYAIVFGKMAPIGGIVYARAWAEYHNAQILYEHNIPTIIPLAVIRYTDMAFDGQEMGAVITLSNEAAPFRLAEVQYLAATQRGKNRDADAYYDRICATLGIAGDPADEKVRMQAVNVLSRQLGKIMFDFSMAGLYRYSPEWSNFEYDFAHKTPFLTDLDSVRELKELSPANQQLQVLRDMGSLVYRLVSKFGAPSCLDSYSLKELLGYDPLAELLSGYFADAHPAQVRQISRTLWNAFIPYLFLLKKNRALIRTEWSNERRRSYKMDHDMFYILAITCLYPLFRDSPLGQKYPSTLTQDQLMKMAERYLGERYEYFEYLLSFKG